MSGWVHATYGIFEIFLIFQDLKLSLRNNILKLYSILKSFLLNTSKAVFEI